MRQSTDTGHFFQTDSALSESERKSKKSKNDAGNPIKLPSKLLAVISDPFDRDAVYVAEAAGTVKRVSLETKSITHTLRPTTSAPVPFTSLATSQTSASTGTLFAGSWDKNIYAWSLESSKPSGLASASTLKEHTDFVKALLCIPATSKTTSPLLISASADKSIIVWNANTFGKLHTLTGHARGVQALALDPLSLPDPLAPAPASDSSVIVASGDSNREIRFWRISADTAYEISSKAAAAIYTTYNDDMPQPMSGLQKETQGQDDIAPLIVHETSIFNLQYTQSGDLWTASADRTTKQLSRMRDFAVDTTLTHNDYVKAVAVIDPSDIATSAGTDGSSGELVVTGCRDEDVRVWDATSEKCIACLRGHWEEVTGLAVVRGGRAIVSVGIDGTVRTWGLSRQELDQAIAFFEQGEEKKASDKGGVALTEDEERELAELMDEDD